MRVNALKIAAASGLIVALVCYRYVVSLGSLPIASNNIYDQQFQMRRFIVDFYQRPVAVNDLGYVSWRNENYVLDLFGLGSRQALSFRMNRSDSAWMDEMARAKGVELVMIYDNWVKGGVPRSWIKLGELTFGRQPVTAEPSVSFYAVTEEGKRGAVTALNRFRPTLPACVEFVYTNESTRSLGPNAQDDRND